MSLGLGNDTDVSFPFTFSFTFLPKTWRKRSWPSLHLDHLLCVNVNGGGGGFTEFRECGVVWLKRTKQQEMRLIDPPL